MKENTKKTIDVVIAGHMCLDVTPIFNEGIKPDLQRIFTPGNLTNMSGIEVAAAGVVPNVGISLHKLGLNPLLMGKVGNDFFGKGILNFLEEKKVDSNIVEAEDINTSYTIVISPPGADRIFFHDPGSNDTFSSADIDFESVKQARLFHFGYPPLMRKIYEKSAEELIKIFQKVKENEVITSLDMAFIDPFSESGMTDWKEILKNLLPFTDIYLPSIEETIFMLKKNYFIEIMQAGETLIEKLDVNILQELGEELLSYGGKIVVIKCGEKGYYIRTPQSEVLNEINSFVPLDANSWACRELLVEAYKIHNIKSTTGAGDSSIAGFIAAILKGCDIEESVKIAQMVASHSIQSYDVFSNISGFDTYRKLLQQNKPTIKLDINSSRWKSQGSGIWKGQNDCMF